MNNLPKLRFPEFWDAGEWEEKKLGEIAALITEKTGNKKYTLMSINAGVGLVSQIEKFGREIAGNSYKNYFVIRENDFAYNKSATKDYPEGFIAMHSSMELAAVPNSIFTCFRTQENKVYPQYLNYLFLCNLHGKWLKQFISVGARAHGSLNIDNKYLLLLPIPLPKGESSLSEQQKIADCLSSIDDRITLETKKLDTLKAHKKGLMQQLFPAEGETIPKLRFPEFHDSGEWEEKKLEDISSFINQKVPLEQVSLLNYISTENLLPDYAGVTTASKLPPLGNATQFLKNDVLISNIRPYLKKVWFADKDGAASNDVIVIRAKASVINEYLAFLLKNDKFIDYVMEGAKGVKMPRGDISLIRQYPLAIPSLTEQQTIADCLSSLDDRLAAETQTIDTLKAHKKGLMQQLFPAEGETLPKLRFPEFRDAGEWEEKRIEDLSIRGSGHTPNKREPSYYNGGIKWVSLADSNKLDNRYIYDTKIKISKEGLENSSAVLHPPGTVIISRDAGVGKSAVLYSAMAVSQHFIVWRCDESKLSNWFLYYFLQVLKPQFEAIATGSTIKTIGLPYFKELCIFTPSIPEQQTIANCLTSLDETIAAQAETIALLKLHKKGLMQQLFPSVEEVKG